MVYLQLRGKSYGAHVAYAKEPSSIQNPPPPNDFHIERLVDDLVIRPPKGALQCTTHNTSARATQNYSIVEDLAQVPLAMSALEVSQTCPTQRKAFLSTIGGIDAQDSMLAIFDMEKCKPPLFHQLAFQVQIFSKGKGIHKTFIDEGASTCVMLASCWLALGSPNLSPPSNSLKAFDGHTFIPKVT